MSNSKETSIYGISDDEIVEGWTEALADQPFWEQLSDKVQPSLLSSALSQLHQVCERMYKEAEEKRMPLLAHSVTIVDTPCYELVLELEEPLMTGIYAGLTLGLNTPEKTAIDVGAYTCLAGIEDQLHGILVDKVLSKSITEGPTIPSREDYNSFKDDLANSMQEKSLTGLSSIIDALSSNAYILSQEGCFDKVEHIKVMATDLELCNLKVIESDHPGTSIALTLRLLWLDEDSDTIQYLPEFTIVCQEQSQGLQWSVIKQTPSGTHV